MPTTATEAVVEFHAPPRLLFAEHGQPSAAPERAALPAGRRRRRDAAPARPRRRATSSRTQPVDLDVRYDEALGHRAEAYQRLLEDAMEGDPRRFGRADSRRGAVADRRPRARRPAAESSLYYKGTWGPAEADALAADVGGWQDPDPAPERAT